LLTINHLSKAKLNLMPSEELSRARAALAADADFALLSSSENITYVSHFDVPVEFGALATLSHAPALALVGTRNAAAALLVAGFYAGWAGKQSADFDVLSYEAINWYEPVDGHANFLNGLRGVLRQAGLNNSPVRLAVEEKSLPTIIARLIAEEFPQIRLVDASAALAKARRTKTKRELDLLRFAAQVNRHGHEALLKQCQIAGKNEFEMWAAVMQAMEKAANQTLFVFGELVTGRRCSVVNYPGGPKDVITQAGDLALMDMSPRVNGYWSDCTNTMVIGGVEPTAKQKLYGVAAREAFHNAADALRPGKQARDAYFAAEATFAKHGLKIGHYAGHQIGVSVNESPRLVPYDDTTIEAGMVFSIETGAYEGADGEAGARMEKSIIVGAAGNELLCDFPWGF
jgi:Xaa-Pro aminopeptidase